MDDIQCKIDDLDRSLKSFPYSFLSLKIKTNKKDGKVFSFC